MAKRDGSITKAVRLVILLDIDDHGGLGNRTLQEIADMFPLPRPDRSTIMRDLRELPRLRAARQRMWNKINPY